MRLNELRQATSLSAAAEEAPPLGTGRLLYSDGVEWICKAVACDLSAPLTVEDVERAVDFYRSRGARPCIELTDHSHPDTFAAVAAGGLRLSEVEHVLAHPLRDLPSPAGPAGLAISRLDATDPGALRAHARLVAGGFLDAGATLTAEMLEGAMRPLRHPDARGFFAHLGGELAGASGMEVTRLAPPGEAAGTICALWGTTVRPAFRRLGVQQALIARRLAEGHAAGAELAVIESLPGIPTARNAARLGFALTYTRLVFVHARGIVSA